MSKPTVVVIKAASASKIHRDARQTELQTQFGPDFKVIVLGPDEHVDVYFNDVEFPHASTVPAA